MNSTTTLSPSPSPSPSEMTPRPPVLSANAIANIVCTAAALIFLTCVLCYITRTFNTQIHKTRVKTALANNRLIEQQIAAAKARAEQKSQVNSSTDTSNVSDGKTPVGVSVNLTFRSESQDDSKQSEISSANPLQLDARHYSNSDQMADCDKIESSSEKIVPLVI